MHWTEYANAFAAFYLISGSLIMKTENIQSSIVFKVVPFFTGSALAIETLASYFR